MQPETLLETLRLVSSELNQRALSQRLGFSVGKTNYILKALVEKGLLKIERFAHSENKLNYRYILTPKGISERISLTECFIERKKQQYQQLSRELESMKANEHQT
jgi:EPS-associated MarR family transcriptional regulator